MVDRVTNYVQNFVPKGVNKVVAETDRLSGANSRLAMASREVGSTVKTQAISFSNLTTKFFAAAGAAYTASAAFRSLKGAAELGETINNLDTLGALSAQSGKEVLAAIQEITRGQVGLAEATRSIALGFSSGFTRDQIEGLAVVALKASKALGVDLTQAQERLTKAAAKREKELLDELGLFVRLDDASAAYAKSLGISANELTEFQKTQAFTNAIIEEGTRKFSTINIETETTAETFTRAGTQISNAGIKIGISIADFVAPAVSALSNNVGLVTAGAVLLAGKLTTSLVPALSIATVRSITLSGTLATMSGILTKGLAFPIAALAATAFFANTLGLGEKLNSLILSLGSNIGGLFSGAETNEGAISGIISRELELLSNTPATIHFNINERETKERLQSQVEKSVREALDDRSFLDKVLTIGGNTLAGAAGGATLGLFFGPVGAGIGATAGAITALVASAIREGSEKGIESLKTQLKEAETSGDFAQAAILDKAIRVAQNTLKYKNNLQTISRLSRITSKDTSEIAQNYRFITKDTEAAVANTTQIFGQNIGFAFINQSAEEFAKFANQLTAGSKQIVNETVQIGNNATAGLVRVTEVLRSVQRGIESSTSVQQFEKNVGSAAGGLVRVEQELVQLKTRRNELEKIANGNDLERARNALELLVILDKQEIALEDGLATLKESVKTAQSFRDVVTRREDLQNFLSEFTSSSQNPFTGLAEALSQNNVSNFEVLVALNKEATQEAEKQNELRRQGYFVGNDLLKADESRASVAKATTAEATKLVGEYIKLSINSEKFFQNMVKAADAASRLAGNQLFSLGQRRDRAEANFGSASGALFRRFEESEAQSGINRLRNDQLVARQRAETTGDFSEYDSITRRFEASQENLFRLRVEHERQRLNDERELIRLDRDQKIAAFNREIAQRRNDLEKQRDLVIEQNTQRGKELSALSELNNEQLRGMADIFNQFGSVLGQALGRDIGDITFTPTEGPDLSFLGDANARAINRFMEADQALIRLGVQTSDFYNKEAEREVYLAGLKSGLTEQQIQEQVTAFREQQELNNRVTQQRNEQSRQIRATLSNELNSTFRDILVPTQRLNEVTGEYEKSVLSVSDALNNMFDRLTKRIRDIAIEKASEGIINIGLKAIGLNKGGIVPEVQHFATGGSVRDTVPAMLTPGEFVMQKPAVDAIGTYNLSRMNSTGKATAEVIYLQPEFNVINETSREIDTEFNFDPESMAVTAVLKDIESNGPTARAIRGLPR